MDVDGINRMLKRVWALTIPEKMTIVELVEMHGRAIASLALEASGGDPHKAGQIVRGWCEDIATALSERTVQSIHRVKGEQQASQEEAPAAEARTGVLRRRRRGRSH